MNSCTTEELTFWTDMPQESTESKQGYVREFPLSPGCYQFTLGKFFDVCPPESPSHDCASTRATVLDIGKNEILKSDYI